MSSCRRNSASYGALSPCGGAQLVVLAVVVLLFLPSAVRETAAAELYPFQSHRRLERGDNETATVRLETPLVFLQQNYSGITVSL